MTDSSDATVPGDAIIITTVETLESDSVAFPSIRVRPRVRFGAIVWGLLVCAISITALVEVGTPDSRSRFAAWFGDLTPSAFVLIGVVALGCLILLGGLLGMIRRAQRTRRAGREGTGQPIG